MPVPNDNDLDEDIDRRFDEVLSRAVEPGQFGVVTAKSAQLQAISERRLVLAIETASRIQERMTTAQEQTNWRLEKLERVGLGLTLTGVILGGLQVGLAIW